MNKKLKICGLSDTNNALEVAVQAVDFIGLIFYAESPRYTRVDATALPKDVARVGVFVDASLEEICEKVAAYALDYVQLHGDESVRLAAALYGQGIAVIRAFRIFEGFDFESVKAYAPYCSYFLFDRYTAKYGGSGKKFDWQVLEKYEGDTPFLLSGGLSPEDVDVLAAFEHPACAGWDINSGFEVCAGYKDVEAVKKFIQSMQDKAAL